MDNKDMMPKDFHNDKMIDELAEKVLDKLIQKAQSPHWHQYNTPMTIGELIKGQLPFKETEEEFLVSEMARLHTLMGLYEGQEEYMKAAIIKRKLDIIQNKLNNL
jgi:hypothetical protein|tara:strand:- start:1384 stop:1698 length:315 start_codon:yes stop_codon:yes gene_type:complete